jgi:hypothetical protein
MNGFYWAILLWITAILMFCREYLYCTVKIKKKSVILVETKLPVSIL